MDQRFDGVRQRDDHGIAVDLNMGTLRITRDDDAALLVYAARHW